MVHVHVGGLLRRLLRMHCQSCSYAIAAGTTQAPIAGGLQPLILHVSKHETTTCLL